MLRASCAQRRIELVKYFDLAVITVVCSTHLAVAHVEEDVAEQHERARRQPVQVFRVRHLERLSQILPENCEILA